MDVRVAESAQDALGKQGVQGLPRACFVNGVALGKRFRRLCAVEARRAAHDARKGRCIGLLQCAPVFRFVFARDPQPGFDIDGSTGKLQRVHPFRGRVGLLRQQVALGQQPRVQLVGASGRAHGTRGRFHGLPRGRERQKRVP